MRPEHRGLEGSPFSSRFKFGLETPLVGRYVGEEKKLVFAPPLWYERLVQACLVGGSASVLSSFLFPNPTWIVGDATWRLWVGTAIVAAGLWALLSNERLVCDLQSRTFYRWEGKGLFKHSSKGRLQDLDAVVLIASRFLAPYGHGVLYRMVLHWKGSRWPLLVVGQWSVGLQPGQALGAGAAPLVALGSRYARSLGVAFYDNSYFDSPAPLRAV